MKKLLRVFQGKDIILRIYLSFAFILALAAALIGIIFLQLYQKNYLNSYTDTLTQQSQIIARRVSKLAEGGKKGQFGKYTTYLDELEKAEQTDVWIVTKKGADHPLEEEYTNAEITSLPQEMLQVLDQAFDGEVAHSSSFDHTYGMVILRVATPIYTQDTREVCGVVMLVSMLDKQRMGVREGKYLITISALLAVLISYIVALGFSRYLSLPLAQIDRDIMRMESGDYSRIEVVHQESQLGRLEVALDRLAERLRKIQEERASLDHLRQDFFANVSHELRTPITVIRGYSETLADGIVTKEETVQEYYQRIVQECQGMERLVGDLFILSKMQNPEFQIEKEPVSLIQIFEDVVRSTRMIGQEKDIQIHSDFPEEDPCLMLGDYDRLRQMFLVIADNAVKFSDPGGVVEFAIRRMPEAGKISGEQEHRTERTSEASESNGSAKIQIEIRDHGVGIPEEELPFIFEKFYKSKLKQNEKGTGLGLMIAKQIALRHGGDIRVESHVGEGTTFYFMFTSCSIEDALEYTS